MPGDSDGSKMAAALEKVRKLNSSYQDQCMTCENWIKLIKKHHQWPDDVKNPTCSLGHGVRTYYKQRGVAAHAWYPNHFGFYTTNNGSSRKAYCSMPPNQLPSTPPSNINWKKLYSFDIDRTPLTRRRTRKYDDVFGVDKEIKNEDWKKPFRSPIPTRKSPRNHSSSPSLLFSTLVSPPQGSIASSSGTNSNCNDISEDAAAPTNYATWVYWTSSEAAREFGLIKPSRGEDNEEITDVVLGRIEKVKAAWQEPRGWRKVIEDVDSQDLYTVTDVFKLRLTCQYLIKALEIAIRDMNEVNMTWQKCCKAAIEEISKCDNWKYIKDSRTITLWHRQFRMNNECFKNKHLASTNEDKARVSHLFDFFPLAKDSLKAFIRANLHHLTTKQVCIELQDRILPQCAALRKDELVQGGVLHANEKYESQQLLEELKIPKLSIPTVYRWMRRLRYKYEVRKKCYYVDNHEKPENKRYRKKFIKRYLTLELRVYRWIQFSDAEYNGFCSENCKLEEQLKSKGFRYCNDDPKNCTLTTDRIEFHVDDHNKFWKKMLNDKVKFGRNMSVCARGEKPLICFGQDECIMKQYLFTNKAWATPEGTRSLTPKDEGMGLMISAFVS
ncbi:unnamed protein product [Cylindrotheca closterium]|uniref:Uncharacterized protein n=1 Tax=Cylindrotheca closterium TaxID=2856 RepID=A0AAD2CTV3_9STRA|nr:unnamed protein product [Cylindrotheca closterium]